MLAALLAMAVITGCQSEEPETADTTQQAASTETKNKTENETEEAEKAKENSEEEKDSSQLSEEEIEATYSMPIESKSGFVRLKDFIPDLTEEIRYATDHNLVGEPIDGYEQGIAIGTVEMAEALRNVALAARELGYGLKVYDAYRPARAGEHFERWWMDDQAEGLKEEFFPGIEKTNLFTQGYLSNRSLHSSGSTIDLTLVDLETGEELDMGTSYDFLDPSSNALWVQGLSDEQIENRALLRNLMITYGFSYLPTEWWHFQLIGDPYAGIYFDFPVNESWINKEQTLY